MEYKFSEGLEDICFKLCENPVSYNTNGIFNYFKKIKIYSKNKFCYYIYIDFLSLFG